MTNDSRPADSDLRTLATGAGLSVLGRIINGALLFLYGIAIARMLDVRAVGILMLGITIVRVAELVARMGLEFGVLHHVAILNGNDRAASVRVTVRNALLMVFAFSLVIAALLGAAAPLLSRVYALPDLAGILWILVLSLPATSMLLVLLGALLALNRFAHNTLAEKLFLPTTHLALCILLIGTGFGIEGASVAYVVAALLTLPLAWHFFNLAAAPSSARAVPISKAELFRFSAPFVAVIVLTQLLVWIDTLMLGLLRDAHEVGIYSAANRTALIASLIIGAFNAIFAPTISNLYYREDFAHLAFLFKTVGKWMFLAALPLVLLILLLSEELLLLFGPDFTSGSTALSLLALTQLAGASMGTVAFMLTMSGRNRLMLLNTMCACAVSAALNWLLIPPFGINGAAVATFVAFMVFQLLALAEVRYTMHMHPYNAGYIKVFAAGAVPFIALALVKSSLNDFGYIYEIVAYSVAYGICYVAGLAILGFAEEDELVLSSVKRKLLGHA